MFDMTFLEANVPLVKAYSLDSKGELVKESYPRVWEFTSHTTTITNLLDAYAALAHRASLGHCLLKGSLSRPLVAESRAGSTDPNLPTWFICLDLDRLAPGVTVEDVLGMMGMGAYSYIVQYSASYGIEKAKGTTAHVIILLTKPVVPSVLKQWLVWQNLHVKLFVDQLALTKTNNAISWPLDTTTCQNDKLIYIAPPTLGEGITPGFEHERIQIVQKSLPALDPGKLVVPSAEQNRIDSVAALDALRTKAGLPARRWTYRLDKGLGLEILAKPDASTLTGIKVERSFVYFNLNGGDSWGYYHPTDSPEVIRNFKGEPNYLTAELLPEYWEQVQRAKKRVQNAEQRISNVVVLAFRDFKSATYYNGTYAPDTAELKLARAVSERQLNDYLAETGGVQLESIPIWDIVYDPADLGPRVRESDRRVNLFIPSKFMASGRVPETGGRVSSECAAGGGTAEGDIREAAGGEQKDVGRGAVEARTEALSRRCPAIYRLIRNAIGQDAGLTDHWRNWFGCILILRKRTGTSWLLQGVEGTGKGALLNRVMIPLLGASNVAVKRMVDFEDQFNGYAETSLLAALDEAQISSSKKSEMIMASLKHQITEPMVSIRKMFAASYLAPNHCNYVLFSNMPDPVIVSPTDRRFNIGEFGPEPLNPEEGFFDQVESELQEFANYLFEMGADLARAGRVYESAQRDLIKAMSSNSVDTTAQALLAGNLEFFWDSLPAGEAGALSIEAQTTSDAYIKLIHDALRAPEGVQRLTRDEVRVLFAYNVGDVAKTPAKFTAMLRHHRVVLIPIRVDGRVVRGLEITWRVDEAWAKERLAELTQRVPNLYLVKEKANAG